MTTRSRLDTGHAYSQSWNHTKSEFVQYLYICLHQEDFLDHLRPWHQCDYSHLCSSLCYSVSIPSNKYTHPHKASLEDIINYHRSFFWYQILWECDRGGVHIKLLDSSIHLQKILLSFLRHSLIRPALPSSSPTLPSSWPISPSTAASTTLALDQSSTLYSGENEDALRWQSPTVNSKTTHSPPVYETLSVFPHFLLP